MSSRNSSPEKNQVKKDSDDINKDAQWYPIHHFRECSGSSIEYIDEGDFPDHFSHDNFSREDSMESPSQSEALASEMCGFPSQTITHNDEEEIIVDSNKQTSVSNTDDNTDSVKMLQEYMQYPISRASRASRTEHVQQQGNLTSPRSFPIPNVSQECIQQQVNQATSRTSPAPIVTQEEVLQEDTVNINEVPGNITKNIPKFSTMKNITVTMRLGKAPSAIVEIQGDGDQNNVTSSTTTFVDGVNNATSSTSTTKTLTSTAAYTSTNIQASSSSTSINSSTKNMSDTMFSTTITASTSSAANVSCTISDKVNTVHYIVLNKSGHPYCKYCGQIGGFTPVDYASNKALDSSINSEIQLVNSEGKIIKKILVGSDEDRGSSSSRNKRRKVVDDNKRHQRHHGKEEKAYSKFDDTTSDIMRFENLRYLLNDWLLPPVLIAIVVAFVASVFELTQRNN